jgi:hypothetical protein
MMKRIILCAITFAWLAIGSDARAAYYDIPVPANAYITHNGADWAWAFPLPAANGLDLSYQSTQGWRIPTADELQLSPLATDFLFPGGNVPFNGIDPATGAYFAATNVNYNNDGAVATPYFSNSYYHADWQDGLGQTYEPWAGMPGEFPFADQLVIRGQVVPEPTTMWISGVVAAMLASTFRARRARTRCGG